MRRMPGFMLVTLLISFLMGGSLLAPATAQAAEWKSVDFRPVLKNVPNYFSSLDISVKIYKNDRKRKMVLTNTSGERHGVSVWRKVGDNASVRVDTVTIPDGASRTVYWRAPKCKREKAAAVTYYRGNANDKFDSSWGDGPMDSASRRC